MKKLSLWAALGALSICGLAHGQATSSDVNGSSGPGTTPYDTSGTATLPAEVVPPSMTQPLSGSTSTSGTSAAQGTVRYVPQTRIPTRAEVRAEAAAMVRAGIIPHGELSTAFQDKGAQLGSTPF